MAWLRHVSADTKFSLCAVLKCFLGYIAKSSRYFQLSIHNGLTVFAFHDVTDRPSPFTRQYRLAVSKETFERQIRWINANFELIHPSAILSGAKLPKRAALITFDDGYRGTFENGLPILEKYGVPSLIFLNMYPILSGSPLLSAATCFLDRTTPAFSKFCRRAGLEEPFHLSLNPREWENYQRDHGDVEIPEIRVFQGEIADLDTLRQWDNNALVCYGNHLFQHWNAIALTLDELKLQYQLNQAELSSFSSNVNLFAFTNGQPNSCFTKRDLELLQALGAGKVFSTVGGVNLDKDEYLLGRIALCESDNTSGGLWYRIGRAVLDNRAPMY